MDGLFSAYRFAYQKSIYHPLYNTIRHYVIKEKTSISRGFFGAPRGIRTHDLLIRREVVILRKV